jgi:UDP-N-acetylmuramoylalanine--D-glutamate ligase
MVDWRDRRVVIVGAARQGISLARYLAARGSAVTINDRRLVDDLGPAMLALSDLEGRSLHPLQWVLGDHPLELLEQADVLCISGGVPLELPLVQAAQERGIPLTNDSQIFLEETPCRVIGITGSAGKTTTTTLVGRMAQAFMEEQAGDARVWVGGNIGDPLIAHVDEMHGDDLAVMELSSFQLDLMTASPQVAAVLNITPNHLDRHKSMEAYTAAKARILDYQSSADVAVLGRDDPGAWSLADRVQGELVTFGKARPEGGPGTFIKGEHLAYSDGSREIELAPKAAFLLRGEHNLLNALAACAIAAAAQISAGAMSVGITGFRGVPHRLELVRSWSGADWVNDSIATAPERSMAALRAYDEPLILLAGGRDKDLPWDEFARLVHQRVDHLIVFGEAAHKIKNAIESAAALSQGAQDRMTLDVCQGLRQAVQLASQLVQPGDVVLLSPGGTSFDEFRDFEERGECFRQLVLQL